jgi:MFS family permease
MMTVFGAGTMIGGPLAGWLSDHHGWQWSFWVQVSSTIAFSFFLFITMYKWAGMTRVGKDEWRKKELILRCQS